ncbi:spore protease YyaC [Anaeromicropila populeti]|uniref:Putative sporulation protein YyaC n=1 Tax=Anaeromicropila populeti TaxID=37658 RepID=A0A1I6LSM4_9FIRM|nr:spore protease YyaC [Anaeromicropila populeti]SFS06471.1 putative sporulation protein YyaC [Anaeromicropila populeti]
MNTTKQEKEIHYYNAKDVSTIYDFCKTFTNMLQKKSTSMQEVVLLCIGSDRATGDCLGPIIGYKLSKVSHPNLFVYGTLDKPVHAKNLNETISYIKEHHRNPVLIAIDASLGSTNHVGYITLGEGSLRPGIGVDKELPAVGDIFITGIVNISGMLNHMLLQTTRLDVVMKLADYICVGVRYAIRNGAKT